MSKTTRHIISYLLLVLAIIVPTATISAVETLLIGDVVSEQTGEPIPNAHVYFRGTKIGTTTDTTGAFCLHVDLNATLKLKVSAVGFYSELYEVAPGTTAGMYVALRERTNELGELFVLPGANPALPLLDSVRRYAPADAQKRTPATLTSDCYFLRRRSTDPIPQSFVEALGLPLPDQPNIYATLIPIGDASILSPLANSGPRYYNYYLADSILTGLGKQYCIDFIPKHGANPLLRGTLYVDSATYHLTRLSSRLPYHANINFVRALRYDADYIDGYVQTDSLDITYDYSVYRDTLSKLPAIRVLQTTLASNHSNDEVTPNSPNDEVTSNSSAAALTHSQAPIDSPLYRTAEWIAYAIQTGYLRTGTWLELGNYTEFARLSSYEGLHLGLPFRTNEKLMKHVSLEGYVAYGFRDRGVKWKAGIQVLLPTERRHLIGAYARDQYIYCDVGEFSSLARENVVWYGNQPFTSAMLGDMLSRHPEEIINTAARRQEGRVWWEADWCPSDGARPSVETTIAYSYNRQATTEATRGMHYNNYDFFRYSETSAVVRFGWGERIADIFTTRRHIYSHFPTLWAGVSLGSWTPNDKLEVGKLFGRLHMTIRQSIPLGIGGQLDYLASAGYIWGDVPAGLLERMDGATGLVYDSYRFNLMKRGCMQTDYYIKLHVNWNGHGVLFNRIPYVCRAKLRELAAVKLAWGGKDSTMNVPYIEWGVGIGNILSVAEVWCVGRATGKNNPIFDTQPWVTCRFRLWLGL